MFLGTRSFGANLARFGNRPPAVDIQIEHETGGFRRPLNALFSLSSVGFPLLVGHHACL